MGESERGGLGTAGGWGCRSGKWGVEGADWGKGDGVVSVTI